ncbi:MAG: UDP-2,3-diacylglucosamine hydrolase [Bacteroidales bacterium 36-12]|nr:MAG: UDP-2,3-diacylglucosamine hydrolase [Bacteroidales bacterium 36-12]
MIYFLSDSHLGSLLEKDPHAHEMKLVRWLDMVKKDAERIYLLGDLFDFWFEYKTVVPKGYVRLFGKLAELTDSGIEIHFFIGNHDLWTFGYFEEEIGLKVHYQPLVVEHHGKSFFLAHGDGLVKTNKGFNVLRRLFHSKISQKLFSLVPPRLGQTLGYYWSKKNREKILDDDNDYKGENNEELVLFAKDYSSKPDIDYFVFGHRHIDLNLKLKNNAHVVILGDFVKIFSYGVFDGENLTLEYFENN